MSEWIVSELPHFSGDGYHYGGGFIVTIPESGLSIQLGGGIVGDSKEWKVRRALAHKIAATPALLKAAEALVNSLASIDDEIESRHYSMAATVPYAHPVALKAALKQARGGEDV